MFDHVWFWKPTELRVINRKGQRCRVLAHGRMNSVLIEFESDGLKVIASRYAIRRIK